MGLPLSGRVRMATGPICPRWKISRDCSPRFIARTALTVLSLKNGRVAARRTRPAAELNALLRATVTPFPLSSLSTLSALAAHPSLGGKRNFRTPWSLSRPVSSQADNYRCPLKRTTSEGPCPSSSFLLYPFLRYSFHPSGEQEGNADGESDPRARNCF